MVEFRHVLCPTDLSETSRPALSVAAALARRYGARLAILHVVPTFDAIQVPPSTLGESVQVVYPSTRDEILALLRQQAEATGAAAAGPYLIAEAGDAVETIIDQALGLSADLIVVGTHGRSGVNRLLHGSVAEALLGRAPCPVLTVPPQAAAPADEVGLRRILCAVDFSPASLQAVGFALDLARQANGGVTLLHVVEFLAESEPRRQAHFNVSEFRSHLLEDARARLEELVAAERPAGGTVQTLVVAGRSYREILRVAGERQADLIVMGAQGRGGIELAVLGSSTHQVIRAAACPVLTVRAARTDGGT